MNIFTNLLTPERTLCKATGKSKKRIFEAIADAFSTAPTTPLSKEIFEQMLAREKLGSTGIGMGIAIPHCRAESCTSPLGVLATLNSDLDFNALDGMPVNLIFALVVPYKAHQEHLDILAEVVKILSNNILSMNLRRSKSSADMHQILTNWKI